MATSVAIDFPITFSFAALKKKGDLRQSDRIFYRILLASGLSLFFLFLLMLLLLLRESFPALSRFGVSFFVSSSWDPVHQKFGVLPLIYGTLASSLLALTLAVPISISAALLLTEILPSRIAKPIGFLIEMLAAIPSVVYGLWGIFVLVPLLRNYVEPAAIRTLGFLPFFSGPPYGVGLFCAGLILSLMILPTICSLSREVFLAVPRSYREAALALGTTPWEMIRIAVLQSSKSGLLGAIFLGLGRALGETMAVTMVIGNRSQISASLFAPAQTMASSIANEYVEATEALHLSSLAAVGFSLFLVTLLTNTLAHLIFRKQKT